MEKDIFKFVEHYTKDGDTFISPEALEMLKDQLLQLDVFRGVREINILPLPAYHAYKDTMGPATQSDVDHFGLGTDSPIRAEVSIDYDHQRGGDLVLSDIVDITCISNYKSYFKEEVEEVVTLRLSRRSVSSKWRLLSEYFNR